MKILSFIPALTALVTAIVVAALPAHDNCGSEIGCEPAHDRLAANNHVPARAVRDLTNAERLRRGLPPKSPFLRRGTRVRRADPSVRPAPDPRPNTITHRGVIQVIDGANGTVLGYVSKTSLKRAQLRHRPNIDSALVVTFETDLTGSGTKLNLAMTNSDTGFSLLGLAQGVTDTDSVLSPGSSEFAVLVGVAAPGTVPGSPPAKLDNSYTSAHELLRAVETAVWTFNAATGTLSPGWVNPDGSLPTVQPFTQSDDAIYVTGDINAFNARYPPATTVISFKFVSL